jgi:hypothetical protein
MEAVSVIPALWLVDAAVETLNGRAGGACCANASTGTTTKNPDKANSARLTAPRL